MLVEIGEKNSLVQEFLYEHESWKSFEKDFLQPRLQLRKGQLLKSAQNKEKDSKFLGMFDDTDFGEDGDEASKFARKDEDGLEKTN